MTGFSLNTEFNYLIKEILRPRRAATGGGNNNNTGQKPRQISKKPRFLSR